MQRRMAFQAEKESVRGRNKSSRVSSSRSLPAGFSTFAFLVYKDSNTRLQVYFSRHASSMGRFEEDVDNSGEVSYG
jgi:hypothetical protein